MRPRISIRFALLFAFAGLVGLVASLLAGSWVTDEARLVRNIATPFVELAQKNGLAHIDSLVTPIRTQLAEAMRLVRAGALPRSNATAIKDALLPSVYELRGVSSMMVGDESGYQLLIMRYDERVTQSPLLRGIQLPAPITGQVLFCTREFRLQEWGQLSRWILWSDDGTLALAAWEAQLEGYDPRQRPWMTEALARLHQAEADDQAHGLQDLIIWTDPYTLFTSKTTGISAVVAAREPGGQIAVVGCDLLLEDLDAYTDTFCPVQHGKAFVLAEDGRVVALPHDDKLASKDLRLGFLSRPIAELEKAGIAGLSQGLLDRYRAGEPVSTYESGGRRWYGSLRPFELGGDKRLLVGIALPSDEIHTMAGHDPMRIALLTALGLAAALVLAFFLSRRISTPLRALVEDSERIGRLDLTAQPLRTSALSELHSLGQSLASTRSALGEHIQARDAAKVALSASETRFRATFEQAAVGLLHVAPNGSILLANQKVCDLLGYSADELTRMNFVDFTHPTDQGFDLDRMQRFLQGEAPAHNREKRCILRDGSERWVEVSTRLLHKENGEPLYFVTAILDIHERKELEAGLRQAQKLEAVGRLAGGVAHDFNNLLTVITGYLHTATSQLSADHPAREDLAHIEVTTTSAAALVKQLLAFARRDSAAPVAIDVCRHVEENKRMLSRLLGADIALSTHTDDGPLYVLMNPTQLQQVLINLSINARDAMPQGGRLTIGVRRGVDAERKRWIEVDVQDTGHGMSEEVRAHAFEPFFTTKDLGRGTGLGLATCYGIVQQAGGEIRLQSAEGKGTSVLLRLHETDTRPAPMAQQAEAVKKRTQATLLLVEDEPQIRTLTQRILSQRGFHVLAAPDAACALQLVRNEPHIDLLVTDVVMPGMQGGQLAARMRAIIPGLRVLFVSGYAPTDLAEDMPADSSFLGKPYTPDELAMAVRAILDQPTRVG